MIGAALSICDTGAGAAESAGKSRRRRVVAAGVHSRPQEDGQFRGEAKGKWSSGNVRVQAMGIQAAGGGAMQRRRARAFQPSSLSVQQRTGVFGVVFGTTFRSSPVVEVARGKAWRLRRARFGEVVRRGAQEFFFSLQLETVHSNSKYARGQRVVGTQRRCSQKC